MVTGAIVDQEGSAASDNPAVLNKTLRFVMYT
jgi:hypothetical protein